MQLMFHAEQGNEDSSRPAYAKGGMEKASLGQGSFAGPLPALSGGLQSCRSIKLS